MPRCSVHVQAFHIAVLDTPLTCLWISPVLPQPGQTEGRAILHGDGVRLLAARASDCPPLEEAINRHDAASLGIGVAERGQAAHAFSFGVDRPASTLRGCAPMWDQAPFEQVKRALACLVVLPNDEQLLARRRLYRRATLPKRLSLTSSPSTIARRRGPELWITRPHMAD
jgi:hypothetical protein